MDKYINTFNTIEDYGVNWENILSPSVSYIKSTKKVIYDAEYTTDKTLAKVGWIAYDNNGITEYYNPKSADVPSLTANNIIGIVVIEADHTDDGTVRVVSLDYMSYTTPTTGSTTAQGIIWGYTGLVPNLDAVDKVVTYVSGTTTTTLNSFGKFASDYDLTSIPQDTWGWNISNCIDNPSYKYISKYNAPWGNTYSLVPCPYTINGSISYDYFNTSGSILSQGLCGAENTDKIMAYVTHSGDILNKYSAGYYPAAECCRAYKNGQWYLPSQAELGYLCANLKEIEFARTVLGRDSLTGKKYFSSLYFNSPFAWVLDIELEGYFGHCYNNSRNSENNVLAFVAL